MMGEFYMTSPTLRKAREYEETFEKNIKKEERPMFHLSPRTGWMNDPNGFSCYDGKYHVFYQYHPYNSQWGPMHWGHAVSEDFLHWEYLPVALAPDEPYDEKGCFSGSAVTLPDGRHLLMYTGVKGQEQENGVSCDVQTQCLAVGDGVEYEKYEGNPVLDEKDLPQGGSKLDFRDPKLWQKKDRGYYCVVGNRPEDGSGQILLFESEDGFLWKFKNTLIENKNRFGKMWECPDFFELDGKWILLTSPQEMFAEGLEYPNGNGTLCMIGEFHEESGTFTEEQNQSVDYGVDFYAPQTTLTQDGRRVMIGWMQNWDTCGIRNQGEPWFGQMSLPRELFLKDGRLCQRPVRELESMRCNQVEYKEVSVGENLTLEKVQGRKIDMELFICPENGEEVYQKFQVRFAQDKKYYTEISFRPQEAVLKIDRKFSGTRRAVVHERCCKVSSHNGKLKLRIILDRFSAEVFVNDGEQVLTMTMYTDQNADGISFLADGKVKMNLVKYDLL